MVNQMRDGFAKLMDLPSSIPLQNEVVSLADNLARTTNRLAEGINTIRTNVQGEIESAIDDINTQFQTIDDLNRSIRNSTALGQKEPDLEDKRDEAVRLIAEQIDINVMKRSDGSIAILDHAITASRCWKTPISRCRSPRPSSARRWPIPAVSRRSAWAT